ncbi:cytochrome P450 2U1-like [Ptychodera flava]|uniref:cytochrome P450 2U1-like n=1 Tax=Ptychodera flava TaxID=63121 RepID=UPI00396A9100
MSVYLIALILVLSVWYLTTRKRPKNLPPGPKGLPLVGSVLTMRKFEYLHDGLEQLRREYGDVFSLRLGCRLFVVLNGYDAIREAFIGKSEFFSDRPGMLSMWQAVTNNGKGIVGSSGATWKKSRKFAQGVLRQFGITTRKANLEHRIQEESRYLVEEFDKKKDKPFEPEPLITGAVANIICSLVFGQRYAYDDAEITKFLGLVDGVVHVSLKAAAVDVIPIVRHVSAPYKELVSYMTQIFNFCKGKIDEHRFFQADDGIRDFIDAYLKEVESAKETDAEQPLTDADMEAAIKDFFFAGIETTAIALTWSLIYMITRPEIQARIHDDIDRVIGRSRQPRLSDEEELPYITATMMEILRIATISPTAAPHCVSADTELRGYHIPKETIVLPHLRSVLYDPKIWPEPEKFEPERFLNEDGTIKKFDEHVPFSVGNRICLGEHLAKMEFFLFFTSLMQQFSFRIPDNYPAPDMKPLFGVGLKPKSYYIHAERR